MVKCVVWYHQCVHKPLVVPPFSVISELPPETFSYQNSLVTDDPTDSLGTRHALFKPAFPVKRVDTETATVACPFVTLASYEKGGKVLSKLRTTKNKISNLVADVVLANFLRRFQGQARDEPGNGVGISLETHCNMFTVSIAKNE